MIGNDSMTSSRPYLLRSLNDWIVDNHLTPYIVCNAEIDGIVIPVQYVENGRIVLNISPFAVQELNIDNSLVTFSARFNGVCMDVQVPISGVLAIYAKENGQGMVFVEDGGDKPPPEDKPDAKAKGPALKLVK